MPKSIKVVLAGKEFAVVELPSRANAAWRKKLQTTVSEALGRVGGIGDTEIRDLKDVSALVSDVGGLIAQAPEMVIDLMLEYAPPIAAAWPELGDQVYDSELMDVFGQVLKLAFPFGKIQGLARLIESGAAARRI